MDHQQETPHQPAKLFTPEGLTYVLESPCQVGRSSEAQITLDDSQVSRHHCIIQQDNRGYWWITDQESTNGTYVNGKKIQQATALKNYDSISAGNLYLFYRGWPNAEEDEFNNEIGSPTHEPLGEGTKINIAAENCWLLIGDIVGSTPMLSDSGGTDVQELIGSWGKRSRSIIEKYGGEVNKFLGDGYLAYWKEADAQTVDMIQLLRSLGTLRDELGLNFRLVMHHGKVQFGGLMQKGEENLSGNAVNFVFKAEKVAAKLGEPILMSDEAASLIQQHNQLRAVGVHTIPGFPGEHAFFTLQA